MALLFGWQSLRSLLSLMSFLLRDRLGGGVRLGAGQPGPGPGRRARRALRASPSRAARLPRRGSRAAVATARRGVVIFRSLDGGFTFEPLQRVAPVSADRYLTAPSVCTRKSVVHASIGVDRSAGANRGSLCVSWADHPPGIPGCSDACSVTPACSADVFVSRSIDNGDTWSSPVRVHEADLSLSDQYHHWLGVDPRDGAVFVAYKDTRDDPGRRNAHVYLNRSRDGGLSFEPSIRVSSASGFAGTRSSSAITRAWRRPAASSTLNQHPSSVSNLGIGFRLFCCGILVPEKGGGGLREVNRDFGV